MKAYPKYDLLYRTVTFVSEDGRKLKQPLSNHEVAILRGYYDKVPGISKFMDQLNKPIEMVKKSCTLDVRIYRHHLKTMNVTTESAKERREYWGFPGQDSPEEVPVVRHLFAND